jgi:hypothetical protein
MDAIISELNYVVGNTIAILNIARPSKTLLNVALSTPAAELRGRVRMRMKSLDTLVKKLEFLQQLGMNINTSPVKACSAHKQQMAARDVSVPGRPSEGPSCGNPKKAGTPPQRR